MTKKLLNSFFVLVLLTSIFLFFGQTSEQSENSHNEVKVVGNIENKLKDTISTVSKPDSIQCAESTSKAEFIEIAKKLEKDPHVSMTQKISDLSTSQINALTYNQIYELLSLRNGCRTASSLAEYGFCSREELFAVSDLEGKLIRNAEQGDTVAQYFSFKYLFKLMKHGGITLSSNEINLLKEYGEKLSLMGFVDATYLSKEMYLNSLLKDTRLAKKYDARLTYSKNGLSSQELSNLQKNDPCFFNKNHSATISPFSP